MSPGRWLTLPLVCCALLLGPHATAEQVAQQRADPDYAVVVSLPAHPPGHGPRVCFDHGHHNFNRLDDRFAAFGQLLRADGYALAIVDTRFSDAVLERCRLLVIANALPYSRPWTEFEYPTPAAFTDHEIALVENWVRGGGRLLLIADHQPMAGAAASLAMRFDVAFNDGFAVDDFRSEDEGRAAFLRPTRFSRLDGTLRPHAVTDGRRPEDRVDHVYTFSGQAFRAGPEARPLLVLPGNFVSLMPVVAWQFTLETPRIPVGGWLQGAALQRGRGKVAVFGEASMFAAQIASDGRRMGMNLPEADQNARLVRNVVDWLTRD